MFDSETAKLLQSAPELSGLDPEEIPQIFTSHYAELVSTRLRGEVTETYLDEGEEWSLSRIAGTYELITSVHTDINIRRASAFVAATAHQILAQAQTAKPEEELPRNITRKHVDPVIVSSLLFLVAEQYADAHEAANSIITSRETQLYEVQIISEHIKNLAQGQLGSILKRAGRWRKKGRLLSDIESNAFIVLIETLICGLELLAGEILLVSPSENTGLTNTNVTFTWASSADTVTGVSASGLAGYILQGTICPKTTN